MSFALRFAYECGLQEQPYRTVNAAEVDRLLRCGWHVVITETVSYCPSTDAQRPGRDAYLSQPFATRAEAQAYAARRYEDDAVIRIIVL
jgi:hypothetical protein